MARAQKQILKDDIKVPSHSLWHRIKKARWAYTFISPFYLLFAIFGLYPMLLSLYLSFTRWKGVGPMEFAGLINFGLVLKDKVFWQSMTNGVILFFLYVPVMLFLALALAVILNSGRVKGFRFFRTLIFLPFITNMVAAGFTFQILLENQNGLFNMLLGFIGLPGIPWLENVWWARISLSLLIIWAWLGYNMVIMLAGLQTIPRDLTEAAQVDGASPVQAFFHIIVPLMRPVILFCAITSTIGSFGLFTEVSTLTRGGPVNATITPLIRIYNLAFTSYQFGYASTLAYTFFAVIFILTIIQFRLNQERE
ncbi:MAG: sugar ABC transporter permease [Planctomycetes bacterium]|nr:sugar ABC transporter permease [Thermoplasmata archaeon]MBE3145134.1 sugar ABC transporter permease [Planctomycetota bacterium]